MSADISSEEGIRISQRSENRDLCEIPASISFLPKTSIPCLIKDISSQGAKVVIEPHVKLPRHVFLLLPVFDEITETRHCELRWRIAGVAGLKFVVLSPEKLAAMKAKPAPFLEGDVPRHPDPEIETQLAHTAQVDRHFNDLLRGLRKPR